MTPRALLTAIGTTALAFAVAIGLAAVIPAAAPGEAGVAAVINTADTTRDDGGVRLAAWNDPCVVAM